MVRKRKKYLKKLPILHEAPLKEKGQSRPLVLLPSDGYKNPFWPPSNFHKTVCSGRFNNFYWLSADENCQNDRSLQIYGNLTELTTLKRYSMRSLKRLLTLLFVDKKEKNYYFILISKSVCFFLIVLLFFITFKKSFNWKTMDDFFNNYWVDGEWKIKK